MLVNPNKAMLTKSEVSDDIKSIEVFGRVSQSNYQ